MNCLNTLYRAFTRRRDAPRRIRSTSSDASLPLPRDFGEVVACLALYVDRVLAAERHAKPDAGDYHLPLCHAYLMAWLRNELVRDQLPCRARGEEWSL